MQCEVCKIDGKPGDFYTVRYGSERSSYVSYKKMLVTRNIVGSEQVFICDACVDRFINKRVLLGSGGFLFIMLCVSLVNFLGGKPVNEQISTIVLGLIGGLILYFVLIRNKKGKGRLQMGDIYAIKLAKPRLKILGYRSFFTRED
jgi:hypothetical protein